MVVDKEQEMKFFISNKTETGNKFGKWHYFCLLYTSDAADE